MSIFIDSCEDQYLTIEQILRLLVYCNDAGNHYINTCDSGYDPEGLLQVDCNYLPTKSLLKKALNQDNAGNPCVSFCSTDNEDLNITYVVDYLGNYVVDYLGNDIIV